MERSPREARSQNRVHSASRRPVAGASPSVWIVVVTRSRGTKATRTVDAPWPNASAAVARAQGVAARARLPTGRRRTASEKGEESKAQQEMGAEEHLEEGESEAEKCGQDEESVALSFLVAREGHQGAKKQPECGDQWVRERKRQEEVPPQHVRPPVGAWVSSKDEGEIREEE